jgi:hypothetical protein
VLFVYYNPMLRRGIAQFLKDAKAAGASGEKIDLNHAGWTYKSLEPLYRLLDCMQGLTLSKMPSNGELILLVHVLVSHLLRGGSVGSLQ